MNMKRVKKSLPRPFHWTIAAILGVTFFILAITITFAEV
jgi:hypothetical protein